MERELFWTSMAYVQASGPFCHYMAFAEPPNRPELQFLHCKIGVLLSIKYLLCSSTHVLLTCRTGAKSTKDNECESDL